MNKAILIQAINDCIEGRITLEMLGKLANAIPAPKERVKKADAKPAAFWAIFDLNGDVIHTEADKEKSLAWIETHHGEKIGRCLRHDLVYQPIRFGIVKNTKRGWQDGAPFPYRLLRCDDEATSSLKVGDHHLPVIGINETIKPKPVKAEKPEAPKPAPTPAPAPEPVVDHAAEMDNIVAKKIAECSSISEAELQRAEQNKQPKKSTAKKPAAKSKALPSELKATTTKRTGRPRKAATVAQ